jgi:uncharacterized membrane protein YiaA
MRIYRPIPKDSETLIVFDENMKEVSIVKIFFYLAGYVCLFGLTVYGLIGGVTSKPVMDKLESFDAWAEQPASKELLFYTGIGLLTIVLFAYALWVFLLRKK